MIKNQKNVFVWLTFAAVAALALASCQKDSDLALQLVKDKLPTVSVVAENNKERMFEDGETLLEITAESRRFKVAEVIRIKAINNDSIEIANFAPVDVKNIIISMTKPDGSNVDLFEADVIGAYVEKRIPFSLDLSDTTPPATVKFNYRGESTTVKGLKKIQTVTWQLKPHDYDPANNPKNNWIGNPSPKQFRLAIGTMINAAYVALEPALLEQMKLDSLNKDGKILLTETEKENKYKQLLNLKTLNIGIVDPWKGTVGLGGGSVYGLTTSIYKQSYVKAQGEVIGHEFGHALGYPHGSNMTYANTVNGRRHSFGLIYDRVWNNVIDAGNMPIKAADYYIPNDFK